MRKPDLIDRYILADLVDANGNVHWEDIANVPSAVDLFPLLTEEEKQQNRWYAEGYGDATKEINEKTEEAYAHGHTDAEAEFRKYLPRGGHWELDFAHNKMTCSECGHTFDGGFDLDSADNFCRHCGADMRGNENG